MALAPGMSGPGKTPSVTEYSSDVMKLTIDEDLLLIGSVLALAAVALLLFWVLFWRLGSDVGVRLWLAAWAIVSLELAQQSLRFRLRQPPSDHRLRHLPLAIKLVAPVFATCPPQIGTNSAPFPGCYLGKSEPGGSDATDHL
jgi:hypothetical protein